MKFNLAGESNKLLAKSAQNKSFVGEILMGASLGPVFSSCSPTYFLILATVLPQSFFIGLICLIFYSVGLALILLLVAFLGQKCVQKLKWAADPEGPLKKGLGILFILVGLFILTGADKKVQTYILDKGFFDIGKVEEILLENVETP